MSKNSPYNYMDVSHLALPPPVNISSRYGYGFKNNILGGVVTQPYLPREDVTVGRAVVLHNIGDTTCCGSIHLVISNADAHHYDRDHYRNTGQFKYHLSEDKSQHWFTNSLLWSLKLLNWKSVSLVDFTPNRYACENGGDEFTLAVKWLEQFFVVEYKKLSDSTALLCIQAKGDNIEQMIASKEKADVVLTGEHQ